MDTSPEKEKAIEVIPMNLEKPTGLEMGDFLPMKFQMMGLGGNTLGGYDSSRFSGFKNFGGPNEPNDLEVSNSILKGHESMMAALTNRGRQIEITQKLWQNKDAKTGKLLYKDLMVSFLTGNSLKYNFLCSVHLEDIFWLISSNVWNFLFFRLYIFFGIFNKTECHKACSVPKYKLNKLSKQKSKHWQPVMSEDPERVKCSIMSSF